MSTSNHRPVAALAPEAADLIEAYFARVHGALLLTAAGECEETVDDLKAHVYDQIARTSGAAADVERVLAAMGTPESLAAQCADGETEPLREVPAVSTASSLFSGKVLGLPYEFRPPTADRVASRWWDPTDPDILVPRVFGIGWDINFAAVAVRVGLIRPDDEDIPFASVPSRWLALSAVLPLVVAATFGILVARYQGTLPAQVAVHWGITGAPDNFASKESALTLPVAMTLIGLGILALAWLRRRSALSRVASGALALMLSTISVGAYAQQIVSASGGGSTAVLLSVMVSGLVLTFLLLVVLARIGRSVEMRRDLEGTSKKGSV
jgi:uncharacterized membrane protein